MYRVAPGLPPFAGPTEGMPDGRFDVRMTNAARPEAGPYPLNFCAALASAGATELNPPPLAWTPGHNLSAAVSRFGSR